MPFVAGRLGGADGIGIWVVALANRPAVPVPLAQSAGLTTNQPPPDPTTVLSSSVERVVTNPALLQPVSVTTSSTAIDSVDDANQPVSYESSNLFDGDPTSAWRAPGDATGQAIIIDLGFDAHITSVALIPGYSKTDPTTGTNRFSENRRVTTVTWQTEDQVGVTQTFVDQPIMQANPVSLDGRIVTLTIEGVTPNGGRDFTAISEIQIYGG